MMRYSVYAVISPEGCSAILWNDPAKVETAANALKITAENLKELNLIDDVINEPLIGAHRQKRISNFSFKRVFLNITWTIKKINSRAKIRKEISKNHELRFFLER